MEQRYRNVFDRMPTDEDFAKAKTEFWAKLKLFCNRVPFARQAVALYYLMRDPAVELKYKATAVLALVYFISPIDLIPDAIPGLGFADDAMVISMAISMLAPVMAKYKEQARKWAESGAPLADDSEVIKQAEIVTK